MVKLYAYIYAQKIFPVLAHDFETIIPVLLVKLLGSKASAYGKWSE